MQRSLFDWGGNLVAFAIVTLFSVAAGGLGTNFLMLFENHPAT